MRILFIGDIVGSSGREIVVEKLPLLKEKYQPDFTIANAENSAHGKGITKKIYNQLTNAGIDCITLGNHAFSKEIVINYIDELENLIRPINLMPFNIGQNYKVFNILDKQICICNIMGEVYMDRVGFSPFKAMDDILETVKADYYFVDLHAETTAEKITFAYFYQDKISGVFGTHTHVQTNDERIINNLAFISDVGMCGVYESVLGRDIEEVISNMVYKEKTKYEVASGEAMLSALFVEYDDSSKKPIKIEKIRIRPNN